MAFVSTTDFLFVILALSAAVVTIFLAAALYHLTKVLRDVEVITGNVRETSEHVNKVIFRPIKLLGNLISKTLFVSGLFCLGSKNKKGAEEEEE